MTLKKPKVRPAEKMNKQAKIAFCLVSLVVTVGLGIKTGNWLYCFLVSLPIAFFFALMYISGYQNGYKESSGKDVEGEY